MLCFVLHLSFSVTVSSVRAWWWLFSRSVTITLFLTADSFCIFLVRTSPFAMLLMMTFVHVNLLLGTFDTCSYVTYGGGGGVMYIM